MEKMISFTPHNYAQAYYIPEPFEQAGYYTEQQRMDNVNGVGDYLKEYKLYLFSSGIKKPVLTDQIMPTQTVHYTKVLQAYVHTSQNLNGLNRILVNHNGARKHYFISEDAGAIQNHIDEIRFGDDNPLLLYRAITKAAHHKLETGKPHKFYICFNPTENNTFEIDMPEGCEFVKEEFRDHATIQSSTNSLINVKVFDFEISQAGNKLSITISPTEMWNEALAQGQITTMGMKPELGRIGLGWITFVFNQPGEFEFPGVAGAYFKVEGEAVVQPEPELININTASQTQLQQLHRVGPTVAGNIVATRNVKPIAGKEDMQRVPRIGPATAEIIHPKVKY